MIIVQIILGGITRLTDSGLSITEWKPILGTIPPTNEREWQKAFDQYKQIAQYEDLHYYFTLDDFKSIYFWEWLHRLWGRFIGLVFLIPFIIFFDAKAFSKRYDPTNGHSFYTGWLTRFNWLDNGEERTE